eukprot:54748_1
MSLFGHPGDKNAGKELWGMSTSKGNNLRCALNITTLNLYLINEEIDTAAGQSGSCIYCHDDDEKTFWISSVHTGGSKSKRQNYGTLLNDNCLPWMQQQLKNINLNIDEKIIQKKKEYVTAVVYKTEIKKLKQEKLELLEQFRKYEEINKDYDVKKQQNILYEQQRSVKQQRCTMVVMLMLIFGAMYYIYVLNIQNKELFQHQHTLCS